MTTRESDFRCLGCGYLLTGLPENRCPECGRPFDPSDPATYRGRTRCGWPVLIGAAMAMLGVMGACVSAAFVWRALLFPNDAGLARICVAGCFVLLIGSVGLGWWAGHRSRKALELSPAATCHRTCFKLALILSTPFLAVLHFPELAFLALLALTILLLRNLP